MLTEIGESGDVRALVIEGTVYHRMGGITTGFRSHKSAVDAAKTLCETSVTRLLTMDEQMRVTNAIRKAIQPYFAR